MTKALAIIDNDTIYMIDGSSYTLNEISIERLVIKLMRHEAINQKIIKNKADNVEIETKTKR